MARRKSAATRDEPQPTDTDPKAGAETGPRTAELSVEEITEKRYAGKESEASPGVSGREKATELQFLWSWVAVGLILVIATLFVVVVLKWFSLERELQTRLIEISKDAAAEPSARLEMYKDISQQTFDRTWRVVDRVILGGFMSLLTLIIGYVFGARRPKGKE